MIPVSVVTGFLGSGKTTLISRLLRDKAMARAAVIVNEFGEIALDHDLIAASDDQVLTLNTGCLCCAMQTDLARTLLELHASHGGEFDRVVIETSGLSDPLPLLQTMMTDQAVTETYRLPYVVTLVDTVHGRTTLLMHHEARNQVALADHILLSKTDLTPAANALLDAVAALNQTAPVTPVVQAAAADLFGDPGGDSRLPFAVRRPAHVDVGTICIERERPLPALALAMWVQALSDNCGEKLLRLKGIVGIEEMPDQPAVIHAVRHVVSEVEFLPRWPTGTRQTRIVVIGRGVPRYFPQRLLDAIEEEVREVNETG